MSKLTLLSAILILSAGAARAEVTIAGHGASTCAEFAEAYRATPQFAKIAYLLWAQGFMSGLNLNADKEKRREPVR